MAHHRLAGHSARAWSVAVTIALLVTGFAGVVPANAIASETPVLTWGTGPLPPSNPSGVQWQGGRVYAITRANGRIYLGGAFTQALSPDGSTAVARPALIAIDAATGQFDPTFDAHVSSNGEVTALEASADGKTIYVGGQFTSLGGTSNRDLGAVDSTTGQAVSGWKAEANGAVLALTEFGGRVYAGGRFDSITDASGTHSQSHLVALDAADGSVVTAWSGNVTGMIDCGRGSAATDPYVRALTVSPDGTRLLVGGCFPVLSGVARPYLGAVSIATGAMISTFRPNGNREVFAIASDGPRVYAAQGGGGGEGTCFDAVTGATRWSIHGNGNFQGVAIMGGLAYFGGHFGNSPTPTDVPRNKLFAVDEVTGVLNSYAPLVNSPLGIFVVRNSGSFLDIAGDFTLVGPSGHPEKVNHFAQLPLPSGPPGPPSSVKAVPGDGTVTLSWTAPDDGGSPITGFTVTPRAGGVAGTPFDVAPGTPPITTIVTGLTNGTPYTFTVVAHNAFGDSAPSVASAAVTPTGPPGEPGAIAAVPGDGAATVSWSAPSDNGGSPITGYVVTTEANAVPEGSRTFTSAATTQTLTGLANGTPYTFTVAAVNARGTGPAGGASAPVTPQGVAPVPDPVPVQVLGEVQSSGYWLLGDDGRVYAFGGATLHGAPAPGSLSAGAADLEKTPSGDGYWIVDHAGHVQAFGAARWLGNAGAMAAGEQVTSLAATPSGQGYWLFTSRGRVFARGDARHLGDMSAVALNAPVLASIATPSGNGYYMVAGDGGIFTFGDARFAGSMGGHRLSSPVRSAVPDPDGTGYWLVAGDGGVFAFDAPFRGSLGGTRLNAPITGMVSFGDGYLLVGADGGVFDLSDRPFSGSLGGTPPSRPIVSLTALA